ncbi:MAG: MBL fold metallo-hydrolase [Pseudomonadota bacterium]
MVLGSGGPELDDGRASTGYLVLEAGRARALVDLGPGSLRSLEDVPGRPVETIEGVYLTHLHADHVGDLPSLVKGSYFTARETPLPVAGPAGNHRMPGLEDYLDALFDADRGAYRYLADHWRGEPPADIRLSTRVVDGAASLVEDGLWQVRTAPVEHGPIPALGYRFDSGSRSVVFTGDLSATTPAFEAIAAGASLIVAHHAIPEAAGRGARSLHLPPSGLGELAQRAEASAMLLSHRMRRTDGHEAETLAIIRERFDGAVAFAEDGACHAVPALP